MIYSGGIASSYNFAGVFTFHLNSKIIEASDCTLGYHLYNFVTSVYFIIMNCV